MILRKKKRTSSWNADAWETFMGQYSGAGKSTYFATFMMMPQKKRFGWLRRKTFSPVLVAKGKVNRSFYSDCPYEWRKSDPFDFTVLPPFEWKYETRFLPFDNDSVTDDSNGRSSG